MFAQLSPLDILIVLAYLCAVLGIGWYQSRKGGNSEDFITGSRQMPWLAVMGSLIATEVSAATFLATPGVGFTENMNFLQMGIGSFLARIFVALIFLGAFYTANSLTIYEFLAKRFGDRTRYTATAFFIVTRLMASAVRLMIAATGLHLILGVPFWACLVVFTLVAVVYTGSGGIRGIIWTDVLQAVVFISCGLIVLAYIGQSIGWGTIISLGQEHGRFEMFQFKPDTDTLSAWFNDPQILYIALLFGFVSTTAALGTDQDLTQRMLTCKDVRSARRSVILSGFVSLPIAALFLMVGIALFAYFQVHTGAELPTVGLDGNRQLAADKVFPWFIGNELPSGLRGLLLVGVLAAAMSSLDSAMGALGSTALVDLYRPLVSSKSAAKPENDLWISRGFVVVFGLILAVIAWALKDATGFLWLTFKIGSITYGALLGIFLLGILAKRGSDNVNWFAMLSGAVLCSLLLGLIEFGLLPLGWTWLILIGTAWTFGVGYCVREKAPRSNETRG